MPNKPFVHLRVFSTYSLANGAIKLSDLADLCKKHQMPAVAITEKSNMFSALEFAITLKQAGIQPITASTLPFTNNNITGTLALYVQSEEGFKNLVYLASYLYQDEHTIDEFAIPLDILHKHSQGLICLTGGMDGIVNKALMTQGKQVGNKLTDDLHNIFDDRLYIELTRHNISEEEIIEEQLLDIAKTLNIPIVATNHIYFDTKEKFKAHDILLCISEGKYLIEEDRPKSCPEFYFKSQEEMYELFTDLPEAIENTVIIAKRCHYIPEEKSPEFPSFICEEGKTPAEQLQTIAIEGLDKHWPMILSDVPEEEITKVKETYINKLYYELGVINSMQYTGYFLIVADFINWAKNQNIPVGPGRGSGVGSLVAWSIGITGVDPIRFNLIFERFLNPDRISLPDFDIDFCQERRDEVIKYVQDKYGNDKVAQIITFGKLQARAVLRDVGRVLQIPYNRVDQICKLVPHIPTNPLTLAQALNSERTLKHLYESEADIREMIDIGLQLEGLNRHASTHAAGLVISNQPIINNVPLYRDQNSAMPVVQYSMYYAEAAGLVKFDFLGLKTLTLISECCKSLVHRGIKLDIETIALNDKATYDMLSTGDNVGIFQFERQSLRETMKSLKPDCIEDLIALGSLNRPGPMENIPTYISRKHRIESPEYMLPMLENILKETFGIIIYQEQVIKIAQVLSGYSVAEADMLRKAMGKKIKKEMDNQREQFINGAIKNGISKSQASQIFELVAKFAGYGFNQAHATAYAIISYQTAYLKAHYRIEFLVACCNLELNDTDKISLFINDAKQAGIEILSPDINKSQPKFDHQNQKVIYALGAIKNVGITAMKAVCEERDQNGIFLSLEDFIKRTINLGINKRQVEYLIKAGAFDSLDNNRSYLITQMEELIKHFAENNKNRHIQMSLFDHANVQLEETKSSHQEEKWHTIQQINYEKEAFGFYLHNHPLQCYEFIIKKLGVINYAEIEKRNNSNKNVELYGLIIDTAIRTNAKGRFAFIEMSDPSSIYSVAIFDGKLLDRAEDIITPNAFLVIQAEIRDNRIIVRNLYKLEEYIAWRCKRVVMEVSDVNVIEKIKDVLVPKSNLSIGIDIKLNNQGEVTLFKLPDQYSITPESLSSIQSCNVTNFALAL